MVTKTTIVLAGISVKRNIRKTTWGLNKLAIWKAGKMTHLFCICSGQNSLFGEQTNQSVLSTFIFHLLDASWETWEEASCDGFLCDFVSWPKDSVSLQSGHCKKKTWAQLKWNHKLAHAAVQRQRFRHAPYAHTVHTLFKPQQAAKWSRYISCLLMKWDWSLSLSLSLLNWSINNKIYLSSPTALIQLSPSLSLFLFLWLPPYLPLHCGSVSNWRQVMLCVSICHDRVP